MAEIEVEKHGPTEANAIKHFGKDVHRPDVSLADDQTQYSDDQALSSETPAEYVMPRRSDTSGRNHRPRLMEYLDVAETSAVLHSVRSS
jgi:hypothetical protein